MLLVELILVLFLSGMFWKFIQSCCSGGIVPISRAWPDIMFGVTGISLLQWLVS